MTPQKVREGKPLRVRWKVKNLASSTTSGSYFLADFPAGITITEYNISFGSFPSPPEVSSSSSSSSSRDRGIVVVVVVVVAVCDNSSGNKW